MSAPLNAFGPEIETRLMALLGQYGGFDAGMRIVRGEAANSQDPDAVVVLPQISVTAGPAVEEIYRTGCMRLGVEITLKTDVDDPTKGTPAKSAENAARIVDVLQRSDLKTLLMATNRVHVHGVVLGEQRPPTTGDRFWEKTQGIEFFGFATVS